MDEGKVLARELEALAEKATPGPFDCMPGYLVRAIRGDMAVPIFETRDVHFDPAITKAPTVRGGDGKVLFRANSEGARISQAERWNHANAELVTLLLNNLPAILSALSAAPSEEVVEKVVVKELEWREPHPSESYPNWFAMNYDVRFEARIDTSRALMFGKFPLAINGHSVDEKFDTVEAAKEYAQNNYASRIRAAISSMGGVASE